MAGFQIGQFVSGGGSSVSIAVPAGSLVLTGYAPAVKTPRTIAVPAGSLTLTGYAPTVLTPRLVSVPLANLTLTGYAPTVVAPATIAIPAGSLVLTGYAPTVLTPRVVQVPAGNLTLTGFAPTVVLPRTVGVPAGSLVLTGFAPTVLAGAVTVVVPVGSLILTGYAPDVLASEAAATVSGPTPAGSKRGRPRQQYFVEWRDNLYKVSGERDGLELIRRLRAEEEQKLARTAPVLAKRAVKHVAPPPLEAPGVEVSGDAPVSVVRAAEQAQRAMAEAYRREVMSSYIRALEWRVARLADDNEGMLALLVDGVGAPQGDSMRQAREVIERIYRLSNNPEATKVYVSTLEWQAGWLADENDTLTALLLDDD